jgi:hypothetical protein
MAGVETHLDLDLDLCLSLFPSRPRLSALRSLPKQFTSRNRLSQTLLLLFGPFILFVRVFLLTFFLFFGCGYCLKFLLLTSPALVTGLSCHAFIIIDVFTVTIRITKSACEPDLKFAPAHILVFLILLRLLDAKILYLLSNIRIFFNLKETNTEQRSSMQRHAAPLRTVLQHSSWLAEHKPTAGKLRKGMTSQESFA